jgi:hypothetical protein
VAMSAQLKEDDGIEDPRTMNVSYQNGELILGLHGTAEPHTMRIEGNSVIIQPARVCRRILICIIFILACRYFFCILVFSNF